MKVSVAMTTFNHEQFISQAIESALMQEVSFDYEIVIGEDCSPDRTGQIVGEYRKEYPHRIRVLPRTRNLGRPYNLVDTLGTCTGQHVALLEGDDYWTSPYKLQEQVDFLDSHPDCAMCFHNVTVFYEDGSREAWNYCPPNQKEIATIEDLLRGNFISTCSIMFRRGLFGEFPDWYYEVAMADWPLHILNAQHGKIGYISKIMGAHRIHHGGAWSAQRRDRKLYLEAVLEVYRYINAHLNFEYERLIKKTMSKYYYDLAMGYGNSGDLARARMYANRYAVEYLSYKHVSNAQLFKMLLRVHAPALYKLIRNLRSHIRPTANG